MYARGHEHGTRTQTAKQSSWYDAIAQENIARIDAEQAAKDDAERAAVTRLAQVVGDAVTAMPEAASRITKAAAIVQAGEVWPLSSGNFLVASQSTTPVAYLVTRGSGWSCECPDYLHRTPKCKHILASMLTVKLGTLYQANYAMPEAA